MFPSPPSSSTAMDMGMVIPRIFSRAGDTIQRVTVSRKSVFRFQAVSLESAVFI
ncbi:MAG TPA: hypothetical protein VMX75_00715 [Spirochaetia bacterium]|nr:hypothetical protein [Spirochaetia bacterium]